MSKVALGNTILGITAEDLANKEDKIIVSGNVTEGVYADSSSTATMSFNPTITYTSTGSISVQPNISLIENFTRMQNGIMEDSGTYTSNYNLGDMVTYTYFNNKITNFLTTNYATNCILSYANGKPHLDGDTGNYIIPGGIRALMPNGFNSDGTYKNVDVTLDGDTTINVSTYNGDVICYWVKDSKPTQTAWGFHQLQTLPETGSNNAYYYIFDENKYYLYTTANGFVEKIMIVLLQYNQAPTAATKYWKPWSLLNLFNGATITQ